MLSVDAARAEVLAAVTGPLRAEEVPLEDAHGRVLAADVRAGADVPGFANSAMDGYALRAGPAGRRLRLLGESRAGRPATVAVQDGTAVAISTGAALPDGADAVVMVERTALEDGVVLVEAPTRPGQNVRHAGEDVRKGQVVLAAGRRLDAAGLGAAVHAGAASLSCVRRPRVALLATGDELRAAGTPLGPGEVHDSNLHTLRALAREAGAEVVLADRVPDDPEATRAAIAAALPDVDLLVLSGGVSVGPHDHVKPSLEAEGVAEVFWRVALRPGGPTWFGTRGGALVLGLPGNPVSSMVTFLLFARPALLALQGADPSARVVRAVLAQEVVPTSGREELQRVVLAGGRATPTGPQGSHVLTSMLGADGLARIPAGDDPLPAGTEVEVELIV